MFAGFDFRTLSVGQPLYLWLLVLPAGLLMLGLWQLMRRRADARRLARNRLLPVRSRQAWSGDLGFWLLGVLASALCIVALARPQTTVATVRRGGVDFVVLLDGSAS